ncbi:restriction endonuclease subunit S [Clostridium pasteurianum]|uniref:restriction endonuclease subunit S n=1 Tax=Clostridium pasteurianum TaxID=1501 RepID=UPI002260B3EB|nr:restriction endonuclease subunit S [Clostridium pasteurianum]UZW12855.1 restriction endonuclease subunit S [Clostridium pasteurianum]
MAKYKRYDRYKESGVNYLGELPNEWKIKPIKYLINSIQTGTTPTTKNEEYFDGEIQWFTPGDFVGNGKLIESSRKISNLAIEDNEAKMFPKNTVAIVGIGATVGKVAKMCVEGSFNQQVTGLVADKEKLYSDYLYYWLDTNKEAIKKIANYTTLPIINNEFIKNYKCYVPNLNEQQTIANFLNEKTSEIDFLIVYKEKLINLLEEKRQSIITEAVTKELNPNVKMKDSGVEWIGEIPEHWSLSKIKYQADINIKTLGEIIDENYEIKYIDIGSVNSNGEIINIENYIFKNSPSRARRIVSKGDTIISTVRTYLKAITWFEDVEENVICSTGFAVLSPRSTIYPKYLFYLMRSTRYIDEIVRRSTGVSYPAITSSEIGKIDCLLPNMKEQIEIVKYIDDQIGEISDLVESITSQIEKLKEYRKSLISEVVTGKIDVKDYYKEN